MRTGIFGIVNITRDSFSDGGRYLDPKAAIERGLALLADGADVLDLGASSSNPDGEDVPPAQEIARLEPVMTALRAAGARLSVDSFQPETQAWCLERGVDWLNDIQGFAEPSLYPRLAASDARLVLMHSVQSAGRADRRETDPEGVFAGMIDFFARRLSALEAAGVARDRIVLDPGMGFFLGATPEPSFLALRRLGALRDRFGLPLLISVSRKSFLGAVTGRGVAERGPATLAAELHCARAGAAWIRTHDVAALRDGLAVEAAIRGG